MYDATPQGTHWGRKNNGGFSLMEILMVLSIMAILGAIGSPKIVSGRQAAQRRAATNQFVSAHRLTRATALRYGRRTEFHVDATGLRFWIVVDTGQTAGTPDTVRMVSLDGTQLTMATNRTILCFDARGLPTTAGACEAADALVTFAEPSKIDTVQFTALGQELR
jgi:prepilin-type N-terminal cleavage/methylation domain-containing protein